MAKFPRASQLIRLFKQATTPTVLQGLNIGDIWIDISSTATSKICTAISPVTFTDMGGSGGSPGGSNTQVQFNDSSIFGGDAGLTYNKTTDVLTAAGGFVGNVTGNASTVTTNANLTGHVTSTGNAAVLGSFTVAQLSTAISDANISGTNTGDHTTTKGDLEAYSSSPTRLAVGSNGKIIYADSTQTTGLRYDYITSLKTYTAEYGSDYTNGLTAADNVAVNSTSGTGATSSNYDSTLATGGIRAGIIGNETGTTTTGMCSTSVASSGVIYGGSGQLMFETCTRLEDLSDGTDTFTSNYGLVSGNRTTINQNSSIFFSYTNGTNSGKFLLNSKNGASATTVDTGITVAADTWYTLDIVLDSLAANVTFYINGTSVGTISTNLPATSTGYIPLNIILKSAGTNTRVMYTDWLKIRKDFDIPR